MNKVALVEKNNIIYEFIKDDLFNISITKITNPDELLMNYTKINPDYLILDVSFEDINPIEFCKKIREKYSLLLPILLVLNFHSTINVDELKNLGVDYLVKPLSKEEIIEKIQSFFKPAQVLPIIIEPAVVEKPEISYEDIIEKIKPILKEEVKTEISNILKQFLEVVEKRNA